MTRLYDVNGNIFAILKAKLESEAVVQSCYIKKVFLEISQNAHENTCARVSFLIKLLWHRCFPVSFAKFLRTPFLTEHLRWLLLLVINFLEFLICTYIQISKHILQQICQFLEINDN